MVDECMACEEGDNAMGEAIVPHKDSMIKIIRAFYPEAKIYLFGSYARGTVNQGSDIDIAIDVGKKMTIHERAFIWNFIDVLPISQRVDLVDLQSVSEKFRTVVLQEGIAW